LATIVKAAITSGNLTFSSKPVSSDVFIIAVPTPYRHTGSDIPNADMSYVQRAMDSVVPCLKKGSLVILESTSPPKSTEEIIIPSIKKAGFTPGEDVGAAYCPERVIPGRALDELIQNDRVIGAINQHWGEYASDLYRSFVSGRIFITEPTVAEMVKIVENTYRDVNIALANEISVLCEKLSINVWDVIHIANRHPRVHVHSPGPGVGGHCISVDPWFLVDKFPKETPLIHLARKVNDSMPVRVAEKIHILLEDKPNAKITILGLAYKGNVDDARESPAISVIENLRKLNPKFTIAVFDPHVSTKDHPTVGWKEAFQDSDLAVVLTAHDEYKYLEPKLVAPLMRQRIILDCHNILKPELWSLDGFNILTLGTPTFSFQNRVSAL
jgi:UDP-N-acetyl-D-mannosaminuronic acid dehydrogenase